jgi:hypothetical protein
MHHFARQFKQSAGMTPHVYLTQKRIERAQMPSLRGGRDFDRVSRFVIAMARDPPATASVGMLLVPMIVNCVI